MGGAGRARKSERFDFGGPSTERETAVNVQGGDQAEFGGATRRNKRREPQGRRQLAKDSGDFARPRDDDEEEEEVVVEEDNAEGDEEEQAATNRVAKLSERIALRCLRVEEECLRRERTQMRLFQEQLRGVRQVGTPDVYC